MMTLVDPCRSIRGPWGNGPGSSISVAIICIKVPSLRTLVNIPSCKMVTLEREAEKRGIDNLGTPLGPARSTFARGCLSWLTIGFPFSKKE